MGERSGPGTGRGHHRHGAWSTLILVGTLLLGGTSLLGVATARAQPADRGYRVGVLLHDGAPPGLLEAFRGRLRELGHVEGQTLAIHTRNAAGRSERLAALAHELLRLRVEVILAVNTPAAQAASRATTTVPIVITRVADPVRSGLVRSLARPGGNVTGLSFNHAELGPKRIQMLREVLPRISRVAVLSDADNPGHAMQIPALERAATRVGLTLLELRVRGPGDFPTAIEAATRARSEALFVLDDTALTRHREPIIKLATSHALPVVSRYRDFAEAGALIAYGPSLPGVYRRGADYVDRILRGASPSELPIEEPTQFDLVVNLRTARALGLSIPPALLLTASHVIE